MWRLTAFILFIPGGISVASINTSVPRPDQLSLRILLALAILILLVHAYSRRLALVRDTRTIRYFGVRTHEFPLDAITGIELVYTFFPMDYINRREAIAIALRLEGKRRPIPLAILRVGW